MRDFVHLHNHTHFSVLDAISTPKKLVEAAIADGQRAIALTDHGVMFGTIEFYKYAIDKGIKPIIGMEAYMANGSRFDKISGKDKDKKHKNYFHLLLLAKNLTGYHNLIKLTSYAHTEGYYYKPRIDKELLEKYSDGLIATSACIGGVINPYILNDEMDIAYKEAKWYKELFGEDFYLEIQNHDLEVDPIILKKAPEIAHKLGIKLVATNDVHYIQKDHATAHNVFISIKDSSSTAAKSDIYDLRYGTPQLYFKTVQEMNDLFKEFPEALDSTIDISDKCDIDLKQDLHMPEFKIPAESKSNNLEDYLKELTIKGLEKKYKTSYQDLGEDLKARAEYELSVINKMKFPGYFLIVQDFVKAAKNLGVSVGPGRGSAAGSLVSYALDITNVDPIKFDLLFERFLNPERYNMPDIDIDFSDDKRELVIDYVKQKYGSSSVALICTFGKITSKAALTDVGRVLGVDLGTIKEITKKIPVKFGKVKPLKDAFELNELKWVGESDDKKIRNLRDFSLVLENNVRSIGTHAAGVVIAPGDIIDYVPLYRTQISEGKIQIQTQYSMNDLEFAGLLKMDFLGLRTLTIIEHTLEMIAKNHNVRIEIDEIDFEDQATYQLIGEGKTLGIFQFESKGMQEYLKQLKPKTLEELTAMNALYRPGPMENIPVYIDRRHGRNPITYLHPIMEQSLKSTYGIIVYQEQVMQLVRDIAGFTLGQADILRRAMGKKNRSVMDKMKPLFIEGAAQNGISEQLANEIFALIDKFADYGFNKSHSLAYSYLAFQTAWLKCHYPAEFFAANMTAELNQQDKIVALIDDAGHFNISLLPPDINRSQVHFIAVDNVIYFGLAAIKNVGEKAVESIINARDEGNFKSIFDFTARIDTRLINKRALEALVCAGAFDSLKCGSRAALYSSIESALDYARAFQEHSQGTDSLFAGDSTIDMKEPSLPEMDEWDHKTILEHEKDVLNFYVSGHPLNDFDIFVKSIATLKMGDNNSSLIGDNVRVCGIVTKMNTKLDKKENSIAFIQIEDFTGKAECVVWSDYFKKYRDRIRIDNVLVVSGKSELTGNDLKIIADEVLEIDEAVSKYSKGLIIKLKDYEESLVLLNEIKREMVNPNLKPIDILFQIQKNDGIASYLVQNIGFPQDIKSINYLRKLFGKDNIAIMV